MKCGTSALIFEMTEVFLYNLFNEPLNAGHVGYFKLDTSSATSDHP